MSRNDVDSLSSESLLVSPPRPPSNLLAGQNDVDLLQMPPPPPSVHNDSVNQTVDSSYGWQHVQDFLEDSSDNREGSQSSDGNRGRRRRQRRPPSISIPNSNFKREGSDSSSSDDNGGGRLQRLLGATPSMIAVSSVSPPSAKSHNAPSPRRYARFHHGSPTHSSPRRLQYHGNKIPQSRSPPKPSPLPKRPASATAGGSRTAVIPFASPATRRKTKRRTPAGNALVKQQRSTRSNYSNIDSTDRKSYSAMDPEYSSPPARRPHTVDNGAVQRQSNSNYFFAEDEFLPEPSPAPQPYPKPEMRRPGSYYEAQSRSHLVEEPTQQYSPHPRPSPQPEMYPPDSADHPPQPQPRVVPTPQPQRYCRETPTRAQVHFSSDTPSSSRPKNYDEQLLLSALRNMDNANNDSEVPNLDDTLLTFSSGYQSSNPSPSKLNSASPSGKSLFSFWLPPSSAHSPAHAAVVARRGESGDNARYRPTKLSDLHYAGNYDVPGGEGGLYGEDEFYPDAGRSTTETTESYYKPSVPPADRPTPSKQSPSEVEHIVSPPRYNDRTYAPQTKTMKGRWRWEDEFYPDAEGSATETSESHYKPSISTPAKATPLQQQSPSEVHASRTTGKSATPKAIKSPSKAFFSGKSARHQRSPKRRPGRHQALSTHDRARSKSSRQGRIIDHQQEKRVHQSERQLEQIAGLFASTSSQDALQQIDSDSSWESSLLSDADKVGLKAHAYEEDLGRIESDATDEFERSYASHEEIYGEIVASDMLDVSVEATEELAGMNSSFDFVSVAEDNLSAYHCYGIVLAQSYIRGFVARKKFRRFYNAAKVIQRYVREYTFTKMCTCRHEEYQRFHNSMILLQSSIRSRRPLISLENRTNLDVEGLDQWKELKLNARMARYSRTHHGFVLLQARSRGALVRKRISAEAKASAEIDVYAKVRAGFILLQSRFRGARVRKLFNVESLVSSQIERYAKSHAGFVLLQARARGMLVRETLNAVSRERTIVDTLNNASLPGKSSYYLHSPRLAILLLQSYVRGEFSRSHLSKLSSKALVIQRAWSRYRKSAFVTSQDAVTISSRAMVEIKSYLCAHFERQRYLRLRKGILMLQARVRGIQARSYAKRASDAVVVLQAYTRGLVLRRQYPCFLSGLVMKQAGARFQVQSSSAITIQKQARGMIQWNKYHIFISGMTLLQARIRGMHARAFTIKICGAAVQLQSVVRGQISRLQYLQRKRKHREDTAATIIQAAIRSWKCRKVLFGRRQQAMITAAVRIQSIARMRQSKTELSRRVQAREMKLAIAATTIQSQVRAWRCQKELDQLQITRTNAAAITIQAMARSWRCQQEVSQLLENHARETAAAKKIQGLYISWNMKLQLQKLLRARILRDTQRSEAAVQIQSIVRSRQCRKKLLSASSRAVIIQRCYRQFKARQGTIILNERAAYVNGLQLMREQVSAAMTLQSALRSWQCQKELSRIKSQVTAAITIQALVRSRKCEQEIMVRREQAHQARNKERETAATTIQAKARSWRYRRESARMKEKEMQKEEGKKIIAATTIQATTRSWMYRQELSRRESRDMAAATKIQATVRSWSCERKLTVATSNAVRIQCCYRNFRLRVSTSSDMRLAYADELWIRHEKAAATTIQSVARSLICQRELMKIREARQAQLMTNAAIIIQLKARSRAGRKELSQRRERKSLAIEENRRATAATVIQAVVRSCLCQQELTRRKALARQQEIHRARHENAAAITLQAVVRSWTFRRKLLDRKEEACRAQHLKATEATIMMQSIIRTWLCQRNNSQLKQEASEMDCRRQLFAATKIQAIVRRWACKKKLSFATTKAVKIQRCYRNFRSTLDMIDVRRSYPMELSERREDAAAVSIQSFARSWRCKRELLNMKEEERRAQRLKATHAATVMQAIVRTHLCRRKYSDRKNQAHLRDMAAATKIQATVRSWSCERKLLFATSNAVKIQRCYRNFRLHVINSSELRLSFANELRGRYEEVAATTIQSVVRTWLCRKDMMVRREQARQVQAAIIIQSRVRSYACQREFSHMKEQKRAVEQTNIAATMIQAALRSWLCQQELSRRRDLARQQEFHRKKMAATTIQAVVRMWLCQKDLMVRKEQARQTQVARQTQAASTIQAIVRSLRCQRELRQRRMHARETVLLRNTAVTTIQSVVRLWACRRQLVLIREQAHQAQTIKATTAAAVKIQSIVRMCFCKDLLRQHTHLRVLLQPSLRGYLVRRHLANLSSKTIIIQRAWRTYKTQVMPQLSNINANSQNQFYQSMLEAQVKYRECQSRRTAAAKKIQVLYLSSKMELALALVKRSVVKLQRIYRGHLARRHVAALRGKRTTEIFAERGAAAVKVQSIIRSYQCREKLITASLHAVTIQRCYQQFKIRHCAATLNERSAYVDQLRRMEEAFATMTIQCQKDPSQATAAIAIQAVVRSRQCQQELLVRRRQARIRERATAATAIQSAIRSWRYKQELSQHKDQMHRQKHLLKTSAATTIQAIVRSRKCQQNLSDRKKQAHLRDIAAATKIQSTVRSWSCERKLTVATSNAVRIQRCYRNFRLHVKSSESRLAYADELRRRHETAAATTIQSAARSLMNQRELLKMKDARLAQLMKNAAVIIQSSVRSRAGRKELSQRKERKSLAIEESGRVTAATVIQAVVRSCLCQQELTRRKALARQLEVHRARHENAAATTLQAVVRSWACRRMVLERKEEARQAQKLKATEATIMMQSIVRTWLCQRNISQMKQEALEIGCRRQLIAATKIQAIVRCWACKKKLSFATTNAVKIQRCYRSFHSTSDMIDLRQSYAMELSERRENAAAVSIQSFARSWRCKRELLKMIEGERRALCLKATHAAAAIQVKETQAATVIQALVRSRLCQNKYSDRREQSLLEQHTKAAAATKIQATVRSWNCKRKLSSATSHAVNIQRCYRNFRLRVSKASELRLSYTKKLRGRYEEVAATTIQSVVRTSMCRRELSWRKYAHQAQLMTKAAIIIQSRVRSNACQRNLCQRKEQRRADEQTSAAAAKIQAAVRSWLCQQELLRRRGLARQQEFHRKEMAATTIQAVVRMWLCRKDMKFRRGQARHAQLMNNAAVIIQSIVRSYACQRDLHERKHRGAVEQTTAAATMIQAVVRSWSCRQQLVIIREEAHQAQTVKIITDAAILIQRMARGFTLRSKLKNATRAATIIQRSWRRCVISLRMKLLQVFKLLNSADPTQHGISVPSPMKKARTLLPKDLDRIRDITPHLPGQHECGIFVEEILNAVPVVIQCTVRRYRAKQKLTKLRLHKRREEELKLSQRICQDTAATTIQAVVRSRKCQHVLLDRRHGARIRETATAATTIQAITRSWICQSEMSLMKQNALQEDELRRKFSAATTIQAVIRSWRCQLDLSRRKAIVHRVELGKRITAATTVQSAIRSWRCQRELSQRKDQIQRHEYRLKTAAATTIQAIVRSRRCQLDISERRRQDQFRRTAAATKIQAVVRSWSCKRKLSVLTKHAVKIQRCYRKYSFRTNMIDLRLSYAAELWKDHQQKTKNPTRFSTEDENEMFILAQIYEHARANADGSYAGLEYLGDSECVSQYVKKFIEAIEQDTLISNDGRC